jgi:hypothetical protein
MMTMSCKDGDDCHPFDALRLRLERVFDQVQVDGETQAKALVHEMEALVREAEAFRLGDLAESARDALAEAWRWRRGDDPMDARVRLARLARLMSQELAQAKRRK